jgi:hypothetical protein
MATKAVSVPVKQATKQPITFISQQELRTFIKLRNLIEKKQKLLESMTDTFKNLLGAGATVEEGVHIANINMTERRNPSWKNEAVELAEQVYGLGEGEKWAAKIIEKTEPVPSVRLVVK